MRKFAFTLLKVIIVAASVAYLYFRLDSFHSEGKFSSFNEFKGPLSYLTLSFIMIFTSGLTWRLEASKWQLLFRHEAPQTIRQSLNTVLLALTGGIITPGKIGEYGLRAATMPKYLQKDAVGKQWLNNFSLTFAGWIIGSLGLSTYIFMLPSIPQGYAFLALIVLSAAIPLIRNVYRKGGTWLAKKLPANWSSFWHDLPQGANLDESRAKQLLNLSLLRYLVFSIGNTLIWWGMGLHQNPVVPFVIIQALFFLSIFVPVVSLFGVVVRGGLAVALATPFNIPAEGVLMAIFFNWIFQTGIPLLVGLILLLKYPFKQAK